MNLLPDLATYIVVVNEGSFTAAAKKLGVTPSALSKLITRLESALSVKLFERTTRSLLITESGKKIYQQSVIMVEAAQQAIDISSSEHIVPSGSLTVAAPKAFLTIVLQALVTPFLIKYPKIQLKLRASDGDINMIAQGIDVVFRLTDKPTEGLIMKEIGKVNLSLCASPSYIEERGLPLHPKELPNHDCLYLGETTDHIWEFVKGEESHVIAVTGRYAVNHSQMRLNGVRDGFGIGIFPDFVIKEALANNDVVPVLSDWQIKGNYHGVIAMQYAQNKYMPSRIKVFTEFVRQNLMKEQS
ncbi:LysR family transcriptional regulator [Aliivibrio salmonicida]|uniref:LysR family transcriptional regulator n=1 Tax=Aliivibrio salmonicida TaxID=40269 RepID=UPI0005C9DEA2|nr:LysR family transcriptional regulator [Aliivibrio salmonicida]AZL86907.1 LysR family transcriptional regulator [Aliivibrio salmonicida]